MRPGIGVCAPNGEPFGLDWWVDIEPTTVLVMEGQASYIPEIRRRLPNTKVYLRAELSGRAWDPPHHMNATEYASLCADLANRYRPDCFIPWNEANIEWKSFGDPAGKEGYVLLRDYARRFIAHYRTLSDVPCAFPALSPGHQEDDGIMGANILAYTADLFDEVQYHTYWTTERGSHLSEWFGMRPMRQNPAYKTSKPVAISEFNRIFNRHDPSDVANYLREIREWRDTLPPNITDVMYFIADSPDASFDTMAIKNNRTLVEGLRDLNKDRLMIYNDLKLSVHGVPDIITPGSTFKITVKAERVDGGPIGEGFAFGRLRLPLKSEDPVETYATDPLFVPEDMKSGKLESDGDDVLVCNVPEFALDQYITATLVVNWQGFSNGSASFGQGEVSVTVGPRGGVPPVAPPPVVGKTPDPHYIFQRVGDLNNVVATAQRDTQAIVEELHRYLANFR